MQSETLKILYTKFYSTTFYLLYSFEFSSVSNAWSKQIDASPSKGHEVIGNAHLQSEQTEQLIASYIDVETTELIGKVGAQINQDEQLVASVHVDIETQRLSRTTSDFETRINDLVAANKAKVNRIKLLVAEKSALLKEIDTLHNMNRSMAETIDAFRAEGNNGESVAHYEVQIGQLKSDNDTLRQRIDRINRDRFDLIAQHELLKTCVQTYTEKVLDEHNYVL